MWRTRGTAENGQVWDFVFPKFEISSMEIGLRKTALLLWPCILYSNPTSQASKFFGRVGCRGRWIQERKLKFPPMTHHHHCSSVHHCGLHSHHLRRIGKSSERILHFHIRIRRVYTWHLHLQTTYKSAILRLQSNVPTSIEAEPHIDQQVQRANSKQMAESQIIKANIFKHSSNFDQFSVPSKRIRKVRRIQGLPQKW